jgi:hypothetical protein
MSARPPELLPEIVFDIDPAYGASFKPPSPPDTEPGPPCGAEDVKHQPKW